jgi:predicted RNase H-like HicB family nuclease
MLTKYIRAAMAKATYEILTEDDGHNYFYGEIPPCRGVLATGESLTQCQEDLQDALEGWLILAFRLGHRIPIINGIDLNPPAQSEAA